MHFAHKTSVTLALLTVSGFSLLPASAQNLVTNPGFETGSFTGWTTDNGVGFTTTPHSGNYAAQFGSSFSGGSGSLSQTILTTAGKSYNISFFLNGNFQPNFYANNFTASFAGFQGENIRDAAQSSEGFSYYAQYSFTATATGASSELQFTGSSFAFTPLGSRPLFLDDISVTDAGPAAVPEASSVISLGVLLTLGLGGLLVSARRRKAGTNRAA